MNRKPLSEVGDSRLCARICGDLCKGGVGIHRGNVENGAVLLADHLLCECLSGNESSEEVEVEDKANSVGVEIKEALCVGIDVADLEIFLVCCCAGVVSARSVYEDVAGAEILCHSICNGETAFFVEDVALVCLSLAALGNDLACKCACRLLVDVKKSNLCARACEHLCEIRAENSARSRYNRDLAAKICIKYVVFHYFSPLSIASKRP